MVALEQESTQRRGIVLVCFGLPRTNVFHLAKHNQLLLNAVPIRRVASHYFPLNPSVTPLIKVFFKVGGEEFRLRSRIHLEGKNYSIRSVSSIQMYYLIYRILNFD